MRKPTGLLKINLKNGNRLIITYMYGFKYSITRVLPSGKKIELNIMDDLKTIVDIIIREKKNAKIKNKPLSRPNEHSIYKYFNKR